MADWNSELYLKFKAERTQPAHDLAAGAPRLGSAGSECNVGAAAPLGGGRDGVGGGRAN